MNSKIKVKAGQIEVEFEGSEDYITHKLLDFVKKLSSLLPTVTPAVPSAIDAGASSAFAHNPKQNLQTTTNAIALKLKVKSCSQLALAACVYLTLVKCVNKCEKRDILSEMKTASHHYNASMSKNLGAALQILVGQKKLREHAKDVYALHAHTKQEMEELLNDN